MENQKRKRKGRGKGAKSSDLDDVANCSLVIDNDGVGQVESGLVEQLVLVGGSELVPECEGNEGVNSGLKDEVGDGNDDRGSECKGKRRRGRKKRDTAGGQMPNLEAKEGLESSAEVVEKGRQIMLGNCSGGSSSSGCLKNKVESESSVGCVASVNDSKTNLGRGDIVNDTEMDDSEEVKDEFPMDLSLPDLSGEDFEQVKRAKKNVDQNPLCDGQSAGALLEGTTNLCYEMIASGVPSCENNNPLDQKRQSAINGSSSSPAELEEMKDNITPLLDQKRRSEINDSTSSPAELAEIKDDVPPVEKNELLQSSMGIVPKKKLLVLDLNGLLVDVVLDVPNKHEYKDYKIIGMKAVFKRPFCDDFLQFCFERFDVGVWSSRNKKNVTMVIDFIMGENRSKLLFCWDQYHCTATGVNTIENRQKPLVLKELRKLWEKQARDLPWKKGDYNESNTLMLDDSPYKALRNPPYTAIFPNSYQYKDKNDNSLGPGGDLRVYLEGLALAEDVQKYVEQNPYGQRPITESNLSWGFYSKLIGPNSYKKDQAESESKHTRVDSNFKIATIEELKKVTKEDSIVRELHLVENFEPPEHVKVKGQQNDECNMIPVEEQTEECNTFCKGETGCDPTCGEIPSTESPEQKGKPVMKILVPLSSEVHSPKLDVAQVSNKEMHPPRMPSSFSRNLAFSSKRKLLVLDVNGLLADIVSFEPDGYKADKVLGDRKVFKRPFVDDFLQFCFERFRIGFWCSTTKRNVLCNLEFLLGRAVRDVRLVSFMWDISTCFDTGFRSVENRNKRIILKELRRLWEKHDPHLPWERGDFDASNTLLVDNNPSTALLNPAHTAIFPPRYNFRDEKDNALGAGGDLREYLQGLALADNVQDYVKSNPFGERPITEKNLSWKYYLKVFESASAHHLEDARLAATNRWWSY